MRVGVLMLALAAVVLSAGGGAAAGYSLGWGSGYQSGQTAIPKATAMTDREKQSAYLECERLFYPVTLEQLRMRPENGGAERACLESLARLTGDTAFRQSLTAAP